MSVDGRILRCIRNNKPLFSVSIKNDPGFNKEEE
jgi:hypothetical protein